MAWGERVALWALRMPTRGRERRRAIAVALRLSFVVPRCKADRPAQPWRDLTDLPWQVFRLTGPPQATFLPLPAYIPHPGSTPPHGDLRLQDLLRPQHVKRVDFLGAGIAQRERRVVRG